MQRWLQAQTGLDRKIVSMEDKQPAMPNVDGDGLHRTLKEKFTRQELSRFFISVAVVSLLLHSIWEISQMAAYKDLTGRPFLEAATRCVPAIFGDVGITIWIYALGALAAHKLSWALRPRWNVYATAGVLGATHAFWIERAAIGSGRWTYTQTMPVVPMLNVGLWPLLQLTVLTPLTIWLANRCSLAPRTHGT